MKETYKMSLKSTALESHWKMGKKNPSQPGFRFVFQYKFGISVVPNTVYCMVQVIVSYAILFILPFTYRYEILAANAIPKGFMDGKQACCLMVR